MDSQSIWDDLWGSPELEKPLKSSGYNSVKMAQYFQQLLISQAWYKGFGIVNIQALAGQLSKWKRTGLESDTLYAMMDAYMGRGQFLSVTSSWQNFVASRDDLLKVVTSISNTGGKTQLVDTSSEEDYDDFDEDKAMRDYLARRNL